MNITYRPSKTIPRLLLSLNLAINKEIHSRQAAMSNEDTMKSIPSELMVTAVSTPCAKRMDVLMSQGKPRANNIDREFAPNAFETPMPP